MNRSVPTRNYCASKVFSSIGFLAILSLALNPMMLIAARSVPNHAVPLSSQDELAPSVVFSNPGTITILDTGATVQSTIAVAGLVGSIATVTLTLNNLNTPRSGQLQFLLVGPGGQEYVFLSDAGGAATATAGATITFSDAAAANLTQSGAIPSGTFRPTDFDVSPAFPAPAPAAPYNHASPLGSATFTSVFGGLSGASVNGNWNLYAYDDGAGGGNSTVNGGWSLDIVVAAAAATTTTLGSSANPSFTNQAITLTSTTTSSATVNTGVVDFFDNTTSVLLCNDAPVNASGVATCIVPAGTLSERTHNITATYIGNATFATSNGSINQTVNTPTVISGGGTVFTNPGGITIQDAGGTAIPYPSSIFVSGLAGTISKVTLTLTNFNSPRTGDVDFLLVGPNGDTYIFMSDAGGALSVTTGATLTFDDSAGSQLPNSGSLSSGTFRPTDYALNADGFPAPAPAGPYNMAPPAGTSTFASVYGGDAPNGQWRLFATDDGGGGGNSTVGSWSLTFTTSADAPTTTVVSGSPNPSTTTQAILFTATVTSTSTVNAGTVTFRQGATILCANVPVNGSGVATCNVPAGTLPQGSHVITADYSGVPGQFNISSGNVTQVINSPTVVTCLNFANNGGITVSNSTTLGNPYPSNIIVSGLGGTIAKVTLTMTIGSALTPDHNDFLLVGPGGQKFLFMSDAGGTTDVVGQTITLDDAAASALPDSTAITTGTYRPSAYSGDPDLFPAPAPAGPYNPAAPEGGSTFAAVFNGISPNGTWQLYAVEDAGDAADTVINNWSLTFTLAAANTTTSVTSSADPSVFGQPVTFTATVSTAGLGTPSGNVQFFDGATPIGSPVALNGSGQAQITISSLSVGDHTITAQYAGAATMCNGTFNASTGSLTGNPQTVNKANTTTTVSSSQNPSNTGTPITFTVTITPVAPGAGTRTGTVDVLRDGQVICNDVMINASGQATCNITFTVASNYNITASYSGDGNFNTSSSSPLVQMVTGPTAANAAVAGRVMDLGGRGVGGAFVTMQDQAGNVMSAVTNPFGYYHFTSVPSGQSYLVSVRHKRYEFQSRTVTVNEDLADIDFVEQGESRGVPGRGSSRLSDRIP